MRHPNQEERQILKDEQQVKEKNVRHKAPEWQRKN